MEFLNLQEEMAKGNARSISTARITSGRGCSISFPAMERICTITPVRKPFWFSPATEWSKVSKGEEKPIKKHDVLCLAAKDYYQIVNTGTEPLVLFGNRSEAFGGAHILADGTDRSKMQQGA